MMGPRSSLLIMPPSNTNQHTHTLWIFMNFCCVWETHQHTVGNGGGSTLLPISPPSVATAEMLWGERNFSLYVHHRTGAQLPRPPTASTHDVGKWRRSQMVHFFFRSTSPACLLKDQESHIPKPLSSLGHKYFPPLLGRGRPSLSSLQ